MNCIACSIHSHRLRIALSIFLTIFAIFGTFFCPISAIRLLDLESELRLSTMPSLHRLSAESSLPLNLQSPEWPQFREAPVFRNGRECIPLQQPSMIDILDALSDNEEVAHLCDPAAIHIAMTLDVTYLRGSVAAILSIVQHSACPENVIFHFLASEYKSELSEILKLTFPYLRFKVYHFDEGLVKDRISSAIREALEKPLNYARSYIPDIIPHCVKRVIYLDSDVIVLDDIAKLWNTDLESHPLGAPVYCHANFTNYFTDVFWHDPTMSGVFDGRDPCYFNTGVMVMDMEMWRFWGFTRAIEEWMEVQRELRIYDLGSLPPFLLVFAGDVKPIEHRWNQHGLGGDNLQGLCRTLHPGPVSLLHWSGKGKPWVRLDNQRPCSLDSLWAPYDLAVLRYM